MKVKAQPATPSKGRLGDWYANFVHGPRGPIVCVSSTTHLAVVIVNPKLRDLPAQLALALRPVLAHHGIPELLIRQELAHLTDCTFSKCTDRSLIAVLNEQAFSASHWLPYEFPEPVLARLVADNIVKGRHIENTTRDVFGLTSREGPGPTVDLLVLAEMADGLLCRELSTGRLVRASSLLEAVPGECVSMTLERPLPDLDLQPVRGKVLSTRLDLSLAGLRPLAFTHGAMEDLRTPEVFDLLERSSHLRDTGHAYAASLLLNWVLEQDLRSIDAHAHLGNLVFDEKPVLALRHYLVGAALGPQNAKRVEWGHHENRPWLRCLHGVALCLWRLGDLKAAEGTLRMLQLNPNDNQGSRFILEEVRSRAPWRADL